jgi:hypothetical protein
MPMVGWFRFDRPQLLGKLLEAVKALSSAKAKFLEELVHAKQNLSAGAAVAASARWEKNCLKRFSSIPHYPL